MATRSGLTKPRWSLAGARWYSVVKQICLLISLCSCLCLVVRRGIGAWYFRKGSPDAIQAAVEWDPSNPQYYDALGTLTHLYADSGDPKDIVYLYQCATRLSPYDAQFWSDLGAGYDLAGRPKDAFDAFERARQLFPNSPEINWRLANFCIRTGNIPKGVHALKTVLLAGSPSRRDVFVLATTATPDKHAILEMLPRRALIFFDYLYFRIQKGDIAEAEDVWTRLLQLNLAFDLSEALPYLDALIQHKELRCLTEAWSALAQRFPAQLERLHSGSNLVANANFAFDILNGGFDWRVVPTEGATVSLHSTDQLEGGRALRITFDGSRNLDYGHVFQYVLVQPNTRYQFSARMRVQGITTDSGPRFQVLDAYDPGNALVSTENLVGTSGWSDQKAEFTTKPVTSLLLLRVARPSSARLDSRIAGTVWIDRVSLTAEP
jgi:tetratricopeptide repeat protein